MVCGVSEPEVAVTVMLVVPAGVTTLLRIGVELPALPHPAIPLIRSTNPIATAAALTRIEVARLGQLRSFINSISSSKPQTNNKMGFH
jgi:hypothetical protein